MEYLKVMKDCDVLQELFHETCLIGLPDANYTPEDLATITLEMKKRGYNVSYKIEFDENNETNIYVSYDDWE